MNSKFNKLVGSPEARLKYKKQCLKSKNILFENDSLQIGCKILPFYDFYSSKNYLQMQIFIGNKTNKKLQRFNIQYRGTANLQLYHQQKPKQIPQNSQYKQRVIVDCLDYDKEILLLFDFQSQVLTLQSIPVPLSLYLFCNVTPQNVSTLPLTASYSQLLDLLSSRFQYIQQTEITANIGIFKKCLMKDLAKYFPSLVQHTENMVGGQFSLRDLTQEYVLVILAKDQKKMKIALAGNQYRHFESILQNLKFLFSE